LRDERPYDYGGREHDGNHRPSGVVLCFAMVSAFNRAAAPDFLLQ
jgi:hypothetical protein